MSTPDRHEARRRALRAAQLVTLSFSLVSCGAITELPVSDAAVVDSGHDAGRDAGPMDPCNVPTATCGAADGLCNRGCGFSYDPDCCACHVMMGCAVTGPFVPPSMA